MLPDAIAYPLIALVAAGLIALALVWPQGEGLTSPGPFANHHLSAAHSGLRGAQPAPSKAASPAKPY